MANPIPTGARRAVHRRAHDRCEYCGGPGAEIHHRQRRREGGHGVENLVLLCSKDHAWAHRNPARARQHGLIVPTSVPVDRIGEVPLLTPYGWLVLGVQYQDL